MKFGIALSFLAAAALAGNVSGVVIKRENYGPSSVAQMEGVESLKGAAGSLTALDGQQTEPSAAAGDGAGNDADVVIVTEYVTVTAGSEENGSDQEVSPEVTDESTGDDTTAVVEDNTTAAEGATLDSTESSSSNIGGESATQQDIPAVSSSVEGDVQEESAASPSASAEAKEIDISSTLSSQPEQQQQQQQDTSSQENTQASSSAESSTESGGDGSSNGGASSGNSETFSGDGTYYTPGLGSCGETNSDSDMVAAINAPQYGASSGDPNSASVCGKCALVKGDKGQVKVKIVDKCPPCKHGDLDLSTAAFKQIGNTDDGRIPITWSFVDC
ncbi:hypothetical protein GGH99_007646 [Coemansia sp. RSA 1285]|nr:hypothetical protein GGH99_007646 [Coemansia sp. RSA 1285]